MSFGRSRLFRLLQAEDCSVGCVAAYQGQSQYLMPEQRADRNLHQPGRSDIVAAFGYLAVLHSTLLRLPLGHCAARNRLRCTILLIFREDPPEIACLGIVILIARVIAIGNYITKS